MVEPHDPRHPFRLPRRPESSGKASEPESTALRQIAESYRRWSEARACHLQAADAVKVAEDARDQAGRAFRQADRKLHELIEALTAGSLSP
jgi:hypothetical protein